MYQSARALFLLAAMKQVRFFAGFIIWFFIVPVYAIGVSTGESFDDFQQLLRNPNNTELNSKKLPFWYELSDSSEVLNKGEANIHGDITGDGLVNHLDAQYAVVSIDDPTFLTREQYIRADVVNIGKSGISYEDILCIKLLENYGSGVNCNELHWVPITISIQDPRFSLLELTNNPLALIIENLIRQDNLNTYLYIPELLLHEPLKIRFFHENPEMAIIVPECDFVKADICTLDLQKNQQLKFYSIHRDLVKGLKISVLSPQPSAVTVGVLVPFKAAVFTSDKYFNEDLTIQIRAIDDKSGEVSHLDSKVIKAGEGRNFVRLPKVWEPKKGEYTIEYCGNLASNRAHRVCSKLSSLSVWEKTDRVEKASLAITQNNHGSNYEVTLHNNYPESFAVEANEKDELSRWPLLAIKSQMQIAKENKFSGIADITVSSIDEGVFINPITDLQHNNEIPKIGIQLNRKSEGVIIEQGESVLLEWGTAHLSDKGSCVVESGIGRFYGLGGMKLLTNINEPGNHSVTLLCRDSSVTFIDSTQLQVLERRQKGVSLELVYSDSGKKVVAGVILGLSNVVEVALKLPKIMRNLLYAT